MNHQTPLDELGERAWRLERRTRECRVLCDLEKSLGAAVYNTHEGSPGCWKG